MGPKPKTAASRTTKPAVAAPTREPRPSTRNAMIGLAVGVLMMAAGLFLHRPPPVGASHWVRENGQYSWDSGADPVTQRLNVVLGCGALLAVLSGALSVQLSPRAKGLGR